MNGQNGQTDAAGNHIPTADERENDLPDMSGIIMPSMGGMGMDQKQVGTPRSIAVYVLDQLKANFYGGGLIANGVFVGGGREGAIICIDMRDPDPSKSTFFEVTDYLPMDQYSIFATWAKSYQISKYELPEGAQF